MDYFKELRQGMSAKLNIGTGGLSEIKKSFLGEYINEGYNRFRDSLGNGLVISKGILDGEATIKEIPRKYNYVEVEKLVKAVYLAEGLEYGEEINTCAYVLIVGGRAGGDGAFALSLK